MSSASHSALAELKGLVKNTTPDSLDGIVARHLLDCVERFGEEGLEKAVSQANTILQGYSISREITRLNDAFRCENDPQANGQLVVTSGVQSLGKEAIRSVLSALRTFNDFTEENDPHHEHDFGSFEAAGHKFFWKIDYYDLELLFHSPNPADPKVTRRVLTIMLPEEY
jgi:hypothetical protein